MSCVVLYIVQRQWSCSVVTIFSARATLRLQFLVFCCRPSHSILGWARGASKKDISATHRASERPQVSLEYCCKEVWEPQSSVCNRPSTTSIKLYLRRKMGGANALLSYKTRIFPRSSPRRNSVRPRMSYAVCRIANDLLESLNVTEVMVVPFTSSANVIGKGNDRCSLTASYKIFFWH